MDVALVASFLNRRNTFSKQWADMDYKKHCEVFLRAVESMYCCKEIVKDAEVDRELLEGG